jgi:DNA-3-methyladenine glycosylase II
LFFEYGIRETDYLRRRDKRLGAQWTGSATSTGGLIPTFSSPLFTTSLDSKSHGPHKLHLEQVAGTDCTVNSETLCALGASELQSLGMTHKKAGYILHFAELVLRKEFDIEALPALPDKTVITQLSSLKGIGVWTAEMILLFCMQRSAVLSYGDLAIHRGMRMLYHHKHIDRERFSKYATRYAP